MDNNNLFIKFSNLSQVNNDLLGGKWAGLSSTKLPKMQEFSKNLTKSTDYLKGKGENFRKGIDFLKTKGENFAKGFPKGKGLSKGNENRSSIRSDSGSSRDSGKGKGNSKGKGKDKDEGKSKGKGKGKGKVVDKYNNESQNVWEDPSNYIDTSLSSAQRKLSFVQDLPNNLSQNFASVTHDLANNVAQNLADNVPQDFVSVAQNLADNVAQNLANNVAQNLANNVPQDFVSVAQNMANSNNKFPSHNLVNSHDNQEVHSQHSQQSDYNRKENIKKISNGNYEDYLTKTMFNDKMNDMERHLMSAMKLLINKYRSLNNKLLKNNFKNELNTLLEEYEHVDTDKIDKFRDLLSSYDK
jgi:hypothetical protein